jgi:Fe-S oxidoreductase
VGLHHLRRLPGGLPGVHRSAKLILEQRRNLVLLQEKVPTDLARTFKNLEQNGNPWGLGADKRMDWAAGKDVPPWTTSPTPNTCCGWAAPAPTTTG